MIKPPFLPIDMNQTPRQPFKVGDKIKGWGTVREITEVRETGYTWKYPDIPDREWYSENSNDPFLKVGWEKVK